MPFYIPSSSSSRSFIVNRCLVRENIMSWWEFAIFQRHLTVWSSIASRSLIVLPIFFCRGILVPFCCHRRSHWRSFENPSRRWQWIPTGQMDLRPGRTEPPRKRCCHAGGQRSTVLCQGFDWPLALTSGKFQRLLYHSSWLRFDNSLQLPAIRPHHKLLLRLIIVIRKKENNRVNVLVSEKTSAHLPVCEINPNRSLHSTLKKYMIEIFGNDLPPHR